jgi:cobaltochelatase CobN
MADHRGLGNLYIHWGGYAYGRGVYGADGREQFRQRLGRLDLTVKNEDSREYDMFTSDDFNSFHGGMNAAVKTAAGKYARSYTGDSSDPRKPIIHSTEEEARFCSAPGAQSEVDRGMRSRLQGRGRSVEDRGLLLSVGTPPAPFLPSGVSGTRQDLSLRSAMQEFFKAHNPYARQNIVERLLEAIARGMWENPGEAKDQLEALLLEAEGAIEDCLSAGMAAATPPRKADAAE